MKKTFSLANPRCLRVLITLFILVCPVCNMGALETSVPDTVPAPAFSLPRGLYEQSFSLSLTCADTAAKLYFTTDGSVPTSDNGSLYKFPLTISSSTPLRVVAVRTDSIGQVLTSPVATSTYILLRDVYNQPNNPDGYPVVWGKYAQISGTATADYEMDPELMESVEYKAAVRNSLKELPIVSLVTDRNHLFSEENNELTGGIYIFTGAPTNPVKPGKGWERPASFEYILPGDSGSLQADCGLQLHGGHSRLAEKCPKHSFRLDFQSEYGLPKLPYPLFGTGSTPQVNSFFLRAGFGHTWVHQTEAERAKAIYTRDRWAKETQLKMGHVSGRGGYAHLFINGLYWGLYNPTERVDDDFCKAYLGGKKSEWDVIKVGEPQQVPEATEGTLEAWNALISLADSAAKPAVYRRMLGVRQDGSPDTTVEALLDVDNFIDYMLINYYGSNTDWDNHNWIAIRNRVNPGKGFIFLCWDSEHLLKTVDGNVLDKNNKAKPTYLFQQLKKNPDFLERLTDRIRLHCFNGGALSPEGALATFKSLADPIDNALYAEAARWGDYRRDVHPYTTKGLLYRKEVHYDANRAWMEGSYFPKRTAVFLEQLQGAGLFDLANVLENQHVIPSMDVVVAPQPFKTDVALLFALSSTSKVGLAVYDPAGRLVWQAEAGWMPAGRHTWNLSLPELAPGIYVGRLTAAGSQPMTARFKLQKAP